MNVIKNYKITVKTLSPICIGSGEKINKKEYWYDRKRKEIGILDMFQMYKGLKKKRLLDKYELYMIFGNQLLMDWIEEQGIKRAELMKWTKYTLDANDVQFNNNSKNEKNGDLLLFCKDAYGRPYIPGSSLKGAFRTMLLTAQILEQSNQYEQKKEELIKEMRTSQNRKEIEKMGKSVEQKGFYTLERRNERGKIQKSNNAASDCMAGIRISDSESLEKDKLMISQKIDITVEGEENNVIVYRECIKPGTEFTFEISIDTSIWKQNGNQYPYTIEQIRKSVDTTFENYENVFLKQFPNREIYPSGTFCLGGGVGYPSKTVVYPLIGRKNWYMVSKILDLVINDENRKNNRDKNISPRVKKCTNYGGKMYDMGLCQWIKTEKVSY